MVWVEAKRAGVPGPDTGAPSQPGLCSWFFYLLIKLSGVQLAWESSLSKPVFPLTCLLQGREWGGNQHWSDSLLLSSSWALCLCWHTYPHLHRSSPHPGKPLAPWPDNCEKTVRGGHLPPWALHPILKSWVHHLAKVEQMQPPLHHLEKPAH